jgi:hypothetical protein
MPVNASGRLLAGRYRVERRLGSGGMGAVHLARDERLGRPVAIKRLPADSPEEAARRFEREARLGASLNHPNLVTVYDTDADEEGVLIVMEYVPGSTLSDELASGPLAPERAVEILTGVAAALDHAHAAGVIHRDVKPANVLLGQGVVKLADLGIATAAETSGITRTGNVLGTPVYMAPEQLEGRDLGPAVDVYALAAVAFEALSGRRARTGRTPLEIAQKVATEPPPDLREVWAAAPDGAAAALCRGMANDPEERPRSAGALVAEVREGLEARGTIATHPLGPPAGRPARPRPSIARPAARPRPAPAGAPEASGGRTVYGARAPRSSRWVAPALLAVVAVLLGIGAFSQLGGGSEEGGSSRSADGERPAPPRRAEREAPRPAAPPAASDTQGEHDEAGEQPSEPIFGGGSDPELGAELNDRGYALSQQGNDEAAVPILRRAVAAFPEDSRGHPYDFALYNLGHSLRASGRPEEAIPYLERRLEISDYKEGIVRTELERARAEAGR